jgi:choline dehydrogenase
VFGTVTAMVLGTKPLGSGRKVRRLLAEAPGARVSGCGSPAAITTRHPACTVAMGTEPDNPLDEKLRVRGMDNLRVADTSALPQIPRANTNALSIMLGDRCADFLLMNA